jgi:AcrR family transcriptional regulator
VFAEKGFHPTTIKYIARQAGIAEGTIYIYFENKTALMLGILDRMNETEQRDEDFSRLTEGDFRSLMKAYIQHRLQVFRADNFGIFRVVISEILVNGDSVKGHGRPINRWCARKIGAYENPVYFVNQHNRRCARYTGAYENPDHFEKDDNHDE